MKSAKVLFDAESYKAANNRAYYAIFYAINAVHALNGKAYKRHKDALGNFNKEYVKTEVFPRSLGRRIAEAEEIRHASDYDDFYTATREEAEEQIITAEEFIQAVEIYCKSQLPYIN
ncbi:MAG: HEPN domain-containing protein [Lachnospiraceae bacterium]|nr:HEPN domain-containing protein [Lachnospiraceae bacterium]